MREIKLSDKTYYIGKLPLEQAFNLRKSIDKALLKIGLDPSNDDPGNMYSLLMNEITDFKLIKECMLNCFFIGSVLINESEFSKLDPDDVFEVFTIILKDVLSKKKLDSNKRISMIMTGLANSNENSTDLEKELENKPI